MKEKACYISLARIISALAVVLIHVNAVFCWENDEYNCWNYGNMIDCFCSFAVPVFIMITGATLMDYTQRYSTKEFLVKRLIKTLIPYVVWSLIGWGYERVTGHEGTFFVYYFFLNLFGVYLCMPLFALIKNEFKEKVILYLVVLSFVINYLLPFVCTVLNIRYIYKIPFEVAGNYLIYALLGYLINKKEVPLLCRIVSYILALSGIAIQYFSAFQVGLVDNPYRAYTGMPCLLYAVGMFIFIKQLGKWMKSERLVNCINAVSGYTFSIYLMHWFVIDLVVKPLDIDFHSLVMRLCIPFLVAVICILLAYIIRKIPVIKRVLP